MIFHFGLSNDLLYKSTEAKNEKFESHLGGLSDEMMAPYVLREFYAKLLFLFYCFKISSNKSDRYSLGAGLAINWIVALEIISLHVMLVGESSSTK